ncbi:SusC/RagA family TonB-linked outer membrane protein [Pedobacter frigiditerrae]|uniref:SusC/RagA family TonB-linked outer membrane protein n=1 Tax=Pedobacter frigiditerrae TaxID=2530452 RepID=A0A4R0MLI1_9SPHI|nr:SusC/RagA family TonB-linked outer membrane protein [Pedobacter frigiditerrae]TCC87032.1 SusC/RagA family TonB-linked outer membrane protein [Pedobacter frigiditerrae]
MKEKLLVLFLLILLSASVNAQQKTITGKITEKGGLPLPGVSVTVPGTRIATQTNEDGVYSITVPNNTTLLAFRFLGYVSKTLTITSGTINVTLEEDTSTLSDVVVTGYGTVKKSDLVGSVVSIRGNQIANRPVQSFDQALGGKAAGVQISIPNGVLNNPPVFRIRGTNSISLSSYPLIIVDGVASFTGDVSGSNAAGNALSSINPQDIETIDILKDAAATAIYGSRAANGVVVITTKRGRTGKATVTYDGWTGIANVQRLPDMMDAYQYTDMKNEGLRNAGTFNAATNAYALTNGPDGNPINTNWYDYAYRQGVSYSSSLSVSGGSESTNYYMSLNYTNQQGIIVKNDYKRLGVLFNIDHKISKTLSVGAKLQYANEDNLAVISSGSLDGQAFSTAGLGRVALVNSPNVSPYSNAGGYNLSGNNLGIMNNKVSQVGFYNPVVQIDLDRSYNYLNRVQSNAFVQYRPIPMVTLRSVYGIDYLYSTNDTFANPVNGDGFAALGSAGMSYSQNKRSVWTTTAQADKTFNNDHTFSLLLGTEQQTTVNTSFGAGRSGLSDLAFNDFTAGYTQFSNTGGFGENYLVSFFGRLNYDYKKKYIVNGTLRQDEYSAFGPDKKAGTFYSFGLGYELAQEDFWKNGKIGKVFSSFKLRGSYGEVGNFAGLGNLAPNSYYSPGLFGGAPTLNFSQAGNSEIGWETSKKLDVGVNFGILKDRITFELAYYKNDIDGLIYNVPQAPSAGLPNSPQTNIGSMYNKGYEFTANAQAITTKNFSWSSSFNFTYNKNVIESLTPTITQFTSTTSGLETANISRVGTSLGMIYVVTTAGVDPATGRRIYVSGSTGRKMLYDHASPVASRWKYEDGSIAPGITSQDQQIYGNSQPKFYGGFNNNFKYKNIDLSLTITYQAGFYIYNGTQASIMDQRFWNNSVDILNRWTTPGQITSVPRVVAGDNMSNGSAVPLDINVYKGDFIKLRDISIGYTVPGSFLTKMKIASARVFVSGQNLLILTKYNGTDPEVSSNGGSNGSQGVERNSVASARVFTAGLNFKF